jgi:carbamoyltransferase
MKSSLGLAKVKYSSSVGYIPEKWDGNPHEIALVLTERLNRKKASGAWPAEAIKAIRDRFAFDLNQTTIAENRDVDHPRDYEEYLNSQMPFDEYLKKNDLTHFSSRFNSQIEFVPHHYAHALVGELMSPFTRAMIIVLDGAGSRLKHIAQEHLLAGCKLENNAELLEECSFYLLDKEKSPSLQLIKKDWQNFKKGQRQPKFEWSTGIGMLYERASEFIFNSNQAAGKVMGLASFGRPSLIEDRERFCDELDWSMAFKGSARQDWLEWSERLKVSDIASSIQEEFEKDVLTRIKIMRERYPEYDKLIFVGGCALNCTTNWKIISTDLAFTALYSTFSR